MPWASGAWSSGSAAVTDPNFVKEAVRVYGDRIAVGCDALNGEVKTAGWVEGSGLDYVDFAKQMESIGVKTLIFTDLATDGMLSGPSFAALERLQKAVSCQIVASGGVSNNEDIRKLKEMGLYGAIIGKAYYAGTIDLAQAVADGRQPGQPVRRDDYVSQTHHPLPGRPGWTGGQGRELCQHPRRR